MAPPLWPTNHRRGGIEALNERDSVLCMGSPVLRRAGRAAVSAAVVDDEPDVSREVGEVRCPHLARCSDAVDEEQWRTGSSVPDLQPEIPGVY
jgi:hypothetical protein